MIRSNPKQRFNPEAKEFLPHSLPYEIHQKPVRLPLPRLSHKFLQKPHFPLQPPVVWLIPAPPCPYFDNFGVPHLEPFFPSFPIPISCYNTNLQPHSPILPTTVYPDNDPDGVGTELKKLSPRGRCESYGGKTLRRKRRAGMWVLKGSKSGIRVVGDSVRSSPSPPPKNGVHRSKKTSVMIRNIPNQYRRSMLLEFLDNLCMEENQRSDFESNPFRLEYDFVYLPMDFRKDNNLGYAFVNFTCGIAANRIHELLGGFKWDAFKGINGGLCHSKKVCEITWARVQGKEELVKHFRNSNFVCRYKEYMPVVFSTPRDSANSAALPTVVGKWSSSG